MGADEASIRIGIAGPNGAEYIRHQDSDGEVTVAHHRLVYVAEYGFESLGASEFLEARNGIRWDVRPENIRSKRSYPISLQHTKTGYEYFKSVLRGEPSFVYHHRLLYVAEHGFDTLAPDEHVHHRNHIPFDNRPENLEAVDQKTHTYAHANTDCEKTGPSPDCTMPGCSREAADGRNRAGLCVSHHPDRDEAADVESVADRLSSAAPIDDVQRVSEDQLRLVWSRRQGVKTRAIIEIQTGHETAKLISLGAWAGGDGPMTRPQVETAVASLPEAVQKRFGELGLSLEAGRSSTDQERSTARGDD